MVDRVKELVVGMFDMLGIQYDDHDIETARTYFETYTQEEIHNFIRNGYVEDES